jgi:hypothetical protein
MTQETSSTLALTAAATRLRLWWTRHGHALLVGALIVMAVLALYRLSTELWRLLADSGPLGAIDLRLRHDEVQRWFADLLVPMDRGYFPASYVLLWPLLGWLELGPARWLWAAVNLTILAALLRFALRASGARTLTERLFVALMLVAPYPLAVTLGNGQLGIVVLAAVLAAAFLLDPSRPATWPRDLLAAGLMLVALVKPSLSAPLFLVLLFRPGRLRPVLLATLGYLVLTVVASGFRSGEVFRRMLPVIRDATRIAAGAGYAHVPRWLTDVGLGSWATPAAVLCLLALGAWVARNRRADPWLLLGVTALVGRMSSYHRNYDDSMILLALLPLFRLAGDERLGDRFRVAAALLLALALGPLLAPITMATRGLPWSLVHEVLAPVVWVAVLVFLALATRSAGSASAASSPPSGSTIPRTGAAAPRTHPA